MTDNSQERENAEALATWLGHSEPSDTYWYLTATPYLMSAAVKRFERFARVTKESRHA